MLKPAIFFDRDDTLITDFGYMYDPKDFQWLGDAALALRDIHQAGIFIFVVTNQGGIGRGLFTESQMQEFHERLRSEAINAGAFITDIAWCPHHPLAIDKRFSTPCACRKPAPGMILSLAQKWEISLSHSAMIGDRQSDIEAGRQAGCHTFLLDSGGSLRQLVRDALSVIRGQLSGGGNHETS